VLKISANCNRKDRAGETTPASDDMDDEGTKHAAPAKNLGFSGFFSTNTIAVFVRPNCQHSLSSFLLCDL
jgi:hypothetical protein